MGTKGATSYTYVTLTSFVLTATFYYYTFRDCFYQLKSAYAYAILSDFTIAARFW